MKPGKRKHHLPEQTPLFMWREQQCKGNWWLPDESDDIVSGTLKFDPHEKITLDLIGAFGDESRLRGLKTAEVVYGSLWNGTPITLYDCFENQFRGGTSAWIVNHCLVGEHLPDKTHEYFDNARLRYSNLEFWAAQTGLLDEMRDGTEFHGVRLDHPSAVQNSSGSAFGRSLSGL